jgi:antitoxin FitA
MGHIQIRNVPDDVHRTLKARAAQKGMSLSDYLLAQVTELARLPTLEEMTERLRKRPRVRLPRSAAEIIREERDERERELERRVRR